jgi:hypothetical protein
VLAVVQHQQHGGAPQPIDDHRLGGAAHVERLAQHLRHSGGRPRVVQAHQPPAIGGLMTSGNLDREPRLAHPGGSDDGHQGVVDQQFGELEQVGTSPDEPR